MKNFKVKYTIQTSSRYGKYNYNCVDTVKANNREEAIDYIKTIAGNKISFKRYKVLIRTVEEIDMSVEIHK